MKYALSGIVLLLYLLPLTCFSQESTKSSVADKVINFPSKLFSRIQGKTADLDKQLTSQTDKYLAKMAKREERIRKKLYKIDSSAAKNLFANSAQQYALLAQKLERDTGHQHQSITGPYMAYADSLRGTLSFLQQNPSLSGAHIAELQQAASQLQALQAKMQDADQVKAYVQVRKQAIGQYISQHANLTGILGPKFTAFKQGQLVYALQVQSYKEMLNDPDALELKALSLLNRFPAFQNFMRTNSQLAGLFGIPSDYASPSGIIGLQTKDQVNALIQSQVSSGGPGGAAALQSNLESAESEQDGFKDKLRKLGGGSEDIDMPDFKPAAAPSKRFFKKLQYGVNMQTTRNNYYYPQVTDLAASVGYAINKTCSAGFGLSYKLGWGNGIQHIAFSSNGMGIRSYFDVKIKAGLSITGGAEYNYTTPLSSYQDLKQLQYWTKSGLIGITKSVPVKNRLFKQTRLQLLWDFLSYQQIPRTNPILFRIGYNIN